MDYCIGKAAVNIKEFYMLPVGEKLMKYDSIAVNTIVKNKNGEINSCDIHYYKDLRTFNREYLANMLNDRFIEIISETVVVDDYINRYVNQFANDYVDTTYLHMMKDEDKEWWTSSDRAMLTSENESNSVCNYKDFAKAVENGYTKKKWITEKDNRVRKTHRPLDDKIIDIKKPFQVGNSLMLFPKDKTYFASDREIFNCRCSIKYIK